MSHLGDRHLFNLFQSKLNRLEQGPQRLLLRLQLSLLLSELVLVHVIYHGQLLEVLLDGIIDQLRTRLLLLSLLVDPFLLPLNNQGAQPMKYQSLISLLGNPLQHQPQRFDEVLMNTGQKGANLVHLRIGGLEDFVTCREVVHTRHHKKFKRHKLLDVLGELFVLACLRELE